MLIGLIADTHGFLGEDALDALAGCDQILHAGDIGSGVLGALQRVAPVLAVRGNNDTSGEAAALPEVASIELAGFGVTVVHRLADAPSAAFDILVFGHCHRQHADTTAAGRLYVNPGAAGRRGFHQRRSVALLHVVPGAPPRMEFIDLGLRRDAPLRAVAVPA